jgi:hypothetical protein
MISTPFSPSASPVPSRSFAFETAIANAPTIAHAPERYKVNGEWFIRTDENETADDNLGELPRC